MKPGTFVYHAPCELAEALELLEEGADEGTDVRVLAGGQSLVPMMNFRLARPDALVDIGNISELRYIRINNDGDLEIGAGTRQQELLRRPEVEQGWPLLREAVRHIGHPQIRSRGTVCGSLAHNDPAAELPAVAVAMNARIQVGSIRGQREVPAESFFVSYYEVALEPGEMIIRVTFPALARSSGWGFREFAQRRGDFAIAGMVCVLAVRNLAAMEPRVVVFGGGPKPMRVSGVERLVFSEDYDFGMDELRRHVSEVFDPISDFHATSEYRREVAAQLLAQCLLDARARRS